MKLRFATAAGVLAAMALSACGGSPSGPSKPPVAVGPTVLSVAPVAGSTAGGTEVTISGTNFAAGASVAIGGVAATNVRVVSATSILAVTGAHAAGAVEVVVTVNGLSSTLAAGFTYATQVPNSPPVITSITIQSPQANAPSNFADLTDDVAVSATVTDAETPVGQLTYEWSSTIGTFTGTGASVHWRAPATAATPAVVTITLRVSEVVGGTTGSQSSSRAATLSLHNSLKEIGDMSRQFLLDFSDSKLAPSYVVRDFWDGCSGKADELSDVTTNRRDFVIVSSTIGPANPVSVGFKAGCVVPKYGFRSGDGCAVVQCVWHDKELSTGTLGTTIGPDYLTAVYRNDRWWLCNSDFPLGTHTNPVSGASFIR